MTTQTRELLIRGNLVATLIIDNHRYDKIRAEILAIHNERFRGDSRIADTTAYKRGQSLAFSNTPRALSYEQRARDLGITKFHVLSPEEVVQYWRLPLPEMDVTFADTDSVALYPNHSQNSDKELLYRRVLDILGIKRAEGPYKIFGLDVEPEDNRYGFNFLETDHVRAEKAPYLERDGWVKYDNGKIVNCDQTEEGAVRILAPESQSGIRRFYRYRSVGLDAGLDDLVDSSGAGRVQIFYDPQSRVQSLEAKV